MNILRFWIQNFIDFHRFLLQIYWRNVDRIGGGSWGRGGVERSSLLVFFLFFEDYDYDAGMTFALASIRALNSKTRKTRDIVIYFNTVIPPVPSNNSFKNHPP